MLAQGIPGLVTNIDLMHCDKEHGQHVLPPIEWVARAEDEQH